MKFVDAKRYKKQVKDLYREAFPKDEQAPLSFLFFKSGNGRDSFYAVVDKEKFVGLVYTVRIEKLVYVFYLAVKAEERGQGYGGKILKMVRKLYSDCVITLAIEDTDKTAADNYQQRLERLRFYEKNGYKQLHIKINEAGVDYELLGTETTVTQADFLAMMKKYFGSVMFRMIYKRTKIE